MKISIRIKILTIFTLLLVTVGSFIIGINYYTGNANLFRFAEILITGANDVIDQQINATLTPLFDRVGFGAVTIKNELIKPVPSPEFTKFLFQFLAGQKNFSGVHWSTPNGDLNLIEYDAEEENFVNEIITCDEKHQCLEVRRQLDQNGKVLSQTAAKAAVFDPRQRPWYVKATTARNYVLSDLYIFYPHPELGATAAVPLYDANNNLYGVFGIDIRLRALSSFVANLKLTPNANIFVFTANDILIAAKKLQNFSGNIIPKISDINVPWVVKATEHYKKTGQKLFFYEYNNQQYLAYYDHIGDVPENPWYIAITLPLKDITGGLTRAVTNSALIAGMILLLGIFLISLISKSISKPIVHLTRDAQCIKDLELDKIKYKKLSHIKEISFLQEAFIAMQQSLSSFIRYVPFSLAKKLVTTGDIAHVGGDNREATFLFVDIEGFTALSEEMEPQILTRYLSEYFEAMTKIIFAYQGTLDKYIGDAMMAFWGAPADDRDHPLHACQCAVAMLNELEDLNKRWQEEQKPLMKLRIGIHSGTAVIGNVGSNDRLSYTAIGDNVNLASRLENLNKLYNTTIIVSETTYQFVKNDYVLRFLDHVAVRGKNRGVRLYELVTPKHDLNKAKMNLEDYNNNFAAALAAYQKGDWDMAVTLFTNLATFYPDDSLIKIYLDRCIQLKKTPPADWQGIWKFT